MAAPEPAVGPPPQRIIHDIPPVWDGKDPGNQTEPYLKLLAGWLATTRTLKTQQGMTILHYASGDLKLIISELDVDVLTSQTSGQQVLDHIKKEFHEYMDKKLPRAMERALFMSEGRRMKHESLIQYVSRKKQLMQELDRTRCVLPDTARGYILLRGALLPDRAWDTLETWVQGDYSWDQVSSALRKLERPIPGRGTTHLTGLHGFEGSSSSDTSVQGTKEEAPIYMAESLFLAPEAFDDEEVLNDALRYLDDPEVVFLAGGYA